MLFSISRPVLSCPALLRGLVDKRPSGKGERSTLGGWRLCADVYCSVSLDGRIVVVGWGEWSAAEVWGGWWVVIVGIRSSNSITSSSAMRKEAPVVIWDF